MERDFEQEFKELKQSEIPDLWNRIEAGLSEKKNVTYASGNIMTVPDKIAVDNGNRSAEKRFSWRKWGTLIAACLCVAIIFPAFSLLVRNKSYPESTSGATACDTAAGAAVDAAAEENTWDAGAEGGVWDTPEAAVDAAAEENTWDAGAEEGAWDMPEAAAEETTDGASDAGGTKPGVPADDAAAEAQTSENAEDSDQKEFAASEETDNMATESARKEETDEAEKTGKEEENKDVQAVLDELPDGRILKEAVVRIQKAEDVGSLYQGVVVQEDADALLKSGAQIVLVCNADTSYAVPAGPRDEKALKEETVYRMTLRYDREERNFVVVTAGNMEE